MEGYLGQVCRSRSLVKSQGHEVKNRFNGHFNGMALGSIDAFIDGDAKETTKYDCIDMIWDVFHAY